MGEFASHDRSHAQSHSSSARSPQLDVVRRTPAELASDAVRASSREVDSLTYSIEAVHQATATNDVAGWTEARASLDRHIASAEKALEQAKTTAHDASPEARAALTASERTLDEAKASASTLVEAPRGWMPAARESEILAVLREPIVGTSKTGYEQKEQALRAELAQLDPAESAALAARLRKAQPGDPIAAEVARLIPERRARIQSFLADARRRQAMKTRQGPGTMLRAPVSAASAPTSVANIVPEIQELAPATPKTIGKSAEVDHEHPTDNHAVNAAGQGQAGFLTQAQRGELNQQARFRLTTVARNYSNALTILEVEQMIKKPDELGFFLTLLLGVAESLLTAYGGLAIKALRQPGVARVEIQALDHAAAKVAETSTSAIVPASAGAVEQAGKEAEKSMLNLTEVQLNSLLKTSLSKGKTKASSGLNPATSDQSSDAAEKSQSMSYIDQLKQEADVAFDHLDQDVGEVSDGVALAYLQAFEPTKHSEAIYKEKLRQKVERYIASPVSKIGRSMDWEANDIGPATHVEKEVRIVRVLVPGYGVRLAAQDSVFDGFLHDHSGTAERSGAYDASSGALSLSQDATWKVGGKEQQRHETPLRPDKILNYIEPEFEALAIQKQEKTWQKPIETYQMSFVNGRPHLVKIAGA